MKSRKLNKLQTFECDVRGHFKHQTACKKCAVDDLVWLIPEPDNEFDENAIKVLDSMGSVLGYIPSEDNEEILELFELDESEYCAKVTEIEVSETEEVLPLITVYIARTKEELPFKQDNKFRLHTHLEKNGKITYSVRNQNYKNEGTQITGNLIVGVLTFLAILLFLYFLIKK